ncbi:MAG: SDR family oxidoreductase [Flavobacteriales bacterium]|nr:MAG: SDR family oxidoreductase [Flavobacteriales bacterium]
MQEDIKTIVITGASSGVGRAIALAFAKKGERIILASRNIDALQELAAECWKLGAEVKCVETDVSNYRSVINLAAEADEFGNGIDVWINNAGILAVGNFEATPMEVNAQVINTNLVGYMNGAHAVLPYFKKQKFGILINNISVGGYLAVPFGAAYSASKFGLRGFSDALKTELSAYPKIRVCDAFPAFLDTPGIQHAANYTNKQLKPAQPVYDPNRIAQEIVRLAEKPKSAVTIGSTAMLLRASYALFPTLTRQIAKGVISNYLKRAKPMENSSGNVFNPVDFGNAVHGGWGLPGKPKAHRKYIASGLLTFAAIGLLLLAKKK